MSGHDERGKKRLATRIGRLEGYTVKTTKKGHLLITNLETNARGMVTCSKSDYRTHQNNAAELRRLGITL
jgi:hypothetical protein